MDKIKDFTDLIAWQEGHKLVLGIYKESCRFPVAEKYCLTDQIRRAAVSITSNIAEGFSRVNPREKSQFYRISSGSISEAQNQLLIARDLGYLEKSSYQELHTLTITVQKLVNGLIKRTLDS